MFYINIEKVLYRVWVTINDTGKVFVPRIIKKYEKQPF